MSIQLSKKHGLNPSMGHCPVCGDASTILLFGRLKGDVEAPRDVQNGLCSRCENALSAGAVMLIEVRDGESGKNPYRTGRITGIKKEAAKRMLPGKDFKKNRIMYIEETALKKIMGGMYKVEVNNE